MFVVPMLLSIIVLGVCQFMQLPGDCITDLMWPNNVTQARELYDSTVLLRWNPFLMCFGDLDAREHLDTWLDETFAPLPQMMRLAVLPVTLPAHFIIDHTRFAVTIILSLGDTNSLTGWDARLQRIWSRLGDRLVVTPITQLVAAVGHALAEMTAEMPAYVPPSEREREKEKIETGNE